MSIDTKTDLSPGVLSMLPMFYVGWSDSVLSPSEISLIHDKLNTFDFLSKEDKTYLIKWTNPKQPPSKEVFKLWIEQLKRYSDQLNDSEKNSLVDFGIEIANQHSLEDQKEIWSDSKTKTALQEIESALGVTGEKSKSLLFSKLYQNDSEQTFSKNDHFDPIEMKNFLDGKHIETRERMRKLLQDPVFKIDPTIVEKEEKRDKTLAQVKALAAQGIGSFAFPEKYGGFAKNGAHIAAFEMLGYHDLSLTIKFGVQFGLFGGAVFLLGTEKHHKKYVEALHTANLLGCFAMTETGHGSNVRGLKTTATYDHDSKEITVHTPDESAGKEYIGNAMHSTMAAVFCQLIVGGENHGVHTVLVPIRDEYGNLLAGVRVEDCGYKMGLNGVDNGRLWFDQVKVPVDNLLDKYGTITASGTYESKIKNPSKRFFTMLGALVVGRICVGLAGNSASKVALHIAVKYALKRRQFGKDGGQEMLIMDYPSHQRRLIPLIAKNYAYHFALRELANKHVKALPDDVRKIETLAAGLKSKASWLTTQTIQTCREACGGKGYLSENRLADLKADTDIFTTFEGDNTVLMQLVAKGKLTEYKQSFHDEGYRAVIKHVYTRFSNKMSSLNPVETRNTNYEHLTDRGFHLHAFKYRETKLLLSLTERMREYLKKRIDQVEAFLKCQNHMLALADAYIDRVVLKAFVRAIRNAEDPGVKAMLNQLCDLYALRVIEENKAWFLENDYMEGSKSKAIRKVVDKICQNLREDADGLVSAYAIPNSIVAAEIVS